MGLFLECSSSSFGPTCLQVHRLHCSPSATLVANWLPVNPSGLSVWGPPTTEPLSPPVTFRLWSFCWEFPKYLLKGKKKKSQVNLWSKSLLMGNGEEPSDRFLLSLQHTAPENSCYGGVPWTSRRWACWVVGRISSPLAVNCVHAVTHYISLLPVFGPQFYFLLFSRPWVPTKY